MGRKGIISAAIVVLLLVGGVGAYLKYSGSGLLIAKRLEGTPVDWPSDIPFYPGAKFLGKTEYKETNATRYNTEISASEDQVSKYYDDELKKSGWTSTSSSGEKHRRWIKDNRPISLSIAKTQSPNISLTLIVNTTMSIIGDGSAKVFPFEPGTKVIGIGDLPHDVPIHEGLVPHGRDRSGGENCRYYYTSTSSIDYKGLTKYYHDTMLEKGWKVELDTTVNSSNPIFQELYRQGERSVAVRIDPSGKQIEVMFILFPLSSEVPDFKKTDSTVSTNTSSDEVKIHKNKELH